MTVICSVPLDVFIGKLKRSRGSEQPIDVETGTKGIKITIFKGPQISIQRDGEELTVFTCVVQKKDGKPVSYKMQPDKGSLCVDIELFRQCLTRDGKQVVFEEYLSEPVL